MESHYIYQFMRHNKYERTKMLVSFNEQLANTEHQLLREVVKYNHVLQEFPNMVKANWDLNNHLMKTYSQQLSFEDTLSTSIKDLNDPKADRLFEEYRRVWTKVIPKYEDTNPEVFSFAYMCQQDLNVANFVEKVLKEDGGKFIDLIYVNSADFPSQELLYSKSIVKTFIDGFHNKFVKMINEVLGVKEEECEKCFIGEVVDGSQFMTNYDYESIVEENFWYNTNTFTENQIHFDLKRIEYTCAKAMKKKYIRFDDKDIPNYDFKDSKNTKNELIIEGMVTKIANLDLDEAMKRVAEEMSEDLVIKSYDFILEVGEYIYQNFLFTDPQRTLKSIIEGITNQIIKKRFSSYDERVHSKLKVGHIKKYFQVIKERKFDFSFVVQQKPIQQGFDT
jgi:hypothetical protein